MILPGEPAARGTRGRLESRGPQRAGASPAPGWAFETRRNGMPTREELETWVHGYVELWNRGGQGGLGRELEEGRASRVHDARPGGDAAQARLRRVLRRALRSLPALDPVPYRSRDALHLWQRGLVRHDEHLHEGRCRAGDEVHRELSFQRRRLRRDPHLLRRAPAGGSRRRASVQRVSPRRRLSRVPRGRSALLRAGRLLAATAFSLGLAELVARGSARACSRSSLRAHPASPRLQPGSCPATRCSGRSGADPRLRARRGGS